MLQRDLQLNESWTETKYAYDKLGRLFSANTAGSTQFPGWGIAETYDRYGNRTTQTVTAGGAFGTTHSISPYTNQITDSGFRYDPSGNLIAAPGATYTYDAENCLTSYNGITYACDGNHVRVTKSSTAGSTVYIYSNGQAIAEYDNGAAVNSPNREHIFGLSNRIATVVGSIAGVGGTITYSHRDHLSPRLYTDSSGALTGEQGTYPFGEGWYSSGASSNWVFTTYQREQALGDSGDDYALARYYSSNLGRFQSPDPMTGRQGNPQSWNRYAYVGNDPINITDPSGRHWEDFLGKFLSLLGEALFGKADGSGSSNRESAQNNCNESTILCYGGEPLYEGGPIPDDANRAIGGGIGVANDFIALDNQARSGLNFAFGTDYPHLKDFSASNGAQLRGESAWLVASMFIGEGEVAGGARGFEAVEDFSRMDMILEKVVSRNGGEIVEGGARFASRRAARQAASELAGNLGSRAEAIRMSEFKQADVPWNLQNSNRVIGRRSFDGSVGWRDDFLGHPQFNMGPHVNVWRGGRNFHLFW